MSSLSFSLQATPPPNSSDHLGPHGPPYLFGDPTQQDIAIARRRVHSSICAFGGNITNNGSEDDRKGDSKSVSKRQKYAEALNGRYYENESRLSWEFEEDPPVIVEGSKDDQKSSPSSLKTGSGGDVSKREYESPNDVHSTGSKDKADGVSSETPDMDSLYCQPISSSEDASTADKRSTSSQSKMKYRCKLCGQPKQNHRCPYQQSLARSIGVMVYPAVNAFTADEPGIVATPLAEMNNFFDGRQDNDSLTPNQNPPRRHSATVTPESMRSSRSSSSRRSKKRMYGDMFSQQPHHYHHQQHGDLLFLESMELQPEQFKYVSVSATAAIKKKPYCYAPLPLPYAQRKRLSDNLFTLSNDVPKLTNECAQVLREAREKDMWDLAVAELMTQVIVIIHCSDRDYRFEGLRQYLLTLGIAC